MSLGTLLNCLDDDLKIAKQTLEAALANSLPDKNLFVDDLLLSERISLFFTMIQMKHKLAVFLLEEVSNCLDNHLPASEQEQIWDYLEDRVALYNLCAKREIHLNKGNTPKKLKELLGSLYPN